MATKDTAKRAANQAAAASSQAQRAALPGADVMAVQVRSWWDQREYPADEYNMACRWAGSLERLWAWLSRNSADNRLCRERIGAVALSPAVAQEIRGSALTYSEQLAQGLEPTAPTALTLARKFDLPIDVVYYYGAGAPKIDTFSRPWLRRGR